MQNISSIIYVGRQLQLFHQINKINWFLIKFFSLSVTLLTIKKFTHGSIFSHNVLYLILLIKNSFSIVHRWRKRISKNFCLSSQGNRQITPTKKKKKKEIQAFVYAKEKAKNKTTKKLYPAALWQNIFSDNNINGFLYKINYFSSFFSFSSTLLYLLTSCSSKKFCNISSSSIKVVVDVPNIIDNCKVDF